MRKTYSQESKLVNYNAAVDPELKAMLDALKISLGVGSQKEVLQEFVNLVAVNRPDVYKKAEEILKVIGGDQG